MRLPMSATINAAMQEICSISFALEPLSDDEPVLSIMPVVNGFRLATLIDEFERARQYEPAGGYAGLVPAHFNFGPLDQYFLATNAESPSEEKRWLLGCTCGEAGCWPLEARVVRTEQQVSWQGFAQPFRRERDYSDFGPFRFDLSQYDRAVAELASAFPRG
jgi:hypothetical protein